METNKYPEWMNDELVKDIPKEKLAFLGQLFTESQGKNKKEMMPYYMTMMKKAKAEHLTFTPPEMNAAIAAIKKHSTPEDIEKINQILSKQKH